jgi:ribonuclease-3
VIGAVFQDKGYNATRRWLLKLLEPELTGLGGGELQVDAKSRLQHTAQVLYGTTPRYHVLSIDGPDHEKVFTVEVTLGERRIATGQGRNKRLAEREAAGAAMVAIEVEHPEIAAGA